jgi:hypothetical protein
MALNLLRNEKQLKGAFRISVYKPLGVIITSSKSSPFNAIALPSPLFLSRLLRRSRFLPI